MNLLKSIYNPAVADSLQLRAARKAESRSSSKVTFLLLSVTATLHLARDLHSKCGFASAVATEQNAVLGRRRADDTLKKGISVGTIDESFID